MAAGTHTKFLVGLMLLVNALVLLNIRRASPELPRAAGSSFRETQRRKATVAGERLQRSAAAAEAATASVTEVVRTAVTTTTPAAAAAARPTNAATRPKLDDNNTADAAATAAAAAAAASAGNVGMRAATATPPSQNNASGSRDGTAGVRGSGRKETRVSDSSSSGRSGGDRLRAGGHQASERSDGRTEAGSGFVENNGEAGGKGSETVHGEEAREPGAGILLEQAERRQKQAEECKDMMETLRIVPNRSWGKAAKPQQQRWELLACNGLVEMGSEKGGDGGGLRMPDCTARPSAESDPLIAVCAGSTTRGVPFPNEQSLALFRFLLPSLARTADCGFRYVAVIGYDVGDGFFDGAAGRAKTLSWFESEVSRPAALRGLTIDLELVKVDNRIKKPGPVFTAVTQAAYDRGANYIYRVNDDSEMHTPWAAPFVNALEAMGPPYGVVGPESLNKNILVHDFTHRLHMDIFDKQYYPPSLTDWFVDDWISRVYGNARTIRAKNCKVEHHTGAHGQRYKEDTTKAGSVNGLVSVGARKISAWAKAHGAEEAAGQILSDKLDGKSAKQASARDIP